MHLIRTKAPRRLPIARSFRSTVTLRLAWTLSFAWTLLFGSMALPGIWGCAQETTAPEENDVRAGLLFPAAGDTAEGRVEAAAWADLGESVLQVELVADGETVKTLKNPPWSFAWEPSVAEPRIIELQARARGENREATSAAMPIWFQPASPPTVVIEIPSITRTVFADDEVFLDAKACDPEDGEIDPKTLRWSSSSGRTAVGPRFPSSVLEDGWHEVTAWAVDSNGNPASHLQRIRVVREQDLSDPVGVARNFVYALNALDDQRLASLLHVDFEVVPCERNEAEPNVAREELLGICRKVAKSPNLDDLRWDGRLTAAGDPSSDWALVDLSGFGIEKTIRLAPEGSDSACAVPAERASAFRIGGMAARILLRRQTSSHWQVWRLQELDHGTGSQLIRVLREQLIAEG